MRYVKILFSLVMWLLMCGLIAGQAQVNFGVSPGVTVLSLVVLTVMLAGARPEHMRDVFMCDLNSDLGVDVRVWAREIIKRYRKDNAFLRYATNEEKYVIGGAAVLIPQPGAKPAVVKNRTVFPATTVRRSDTTVLYELEPYSTTPSHITWSELQTISYDKINDIITDHFGTLLEDMADDMIIKWISGLPAANILYTSGEATEALESGQTGLRKAVTYKDVMRMQAVMNKNNVPKVGRCLTFEENMFQQFASDIAASPYRDAIKEYDMKEGTVGRLFGFDLITRSSVGVAAAELDGDTLDVNALSAAVAEDDDVCCVAFHRSAVAQAMGSVQMFSKKGDPNYYGDVFSTEARQGGRRRRADDLGILVLKQAKTGGV